MKIVDQWLSRLSAFRLSVFQKWELQKIRDAWRIFTSLHRNTASSWRKAKILVTKMVGHWFLGIFGQFSGFRWNWKAKKQDYWEREANRRISLEHCCCLQAAESKILSADLVNHFPMVKCYEKIIASKIFSLRSSNQLLGTAWKSETLFFGPRGNFSRAVLVENSLQVKLIEKSVAISCLQALFVVFLTRKLQLKIWESPLSKKQIKKQTKSIVFVICDLQNP